MAKPKESTNEVGVVVNKQVVNAVAATNYAVLGESGNEAQGVAFESMAHSLALAMQNAQATQFGAKQISSTCVAKTCAAILSIS
jgi:killing trait domain-containing protein